MPIVRTAWKREEIPANAQNITEHTRTDYKGEEYKVWRYELFVGACVYEFERNGYSDSDFYMVYYDAEADEFKTTEFATTRFGCTFEFNSSVDATPEIRAKYEEYLEKGRKARAAAEQERRKRTPEKGKILKVVKGRKVPIGTIGLCIWRGNGGGPEWQHRPDRVGIKDANGNIFWTTVTNCVVIGIPTCSDCNEFKPGEDDKPGTCCGYEGTNGKTYEREPDRVVCVRHFQAKYGTYEFWDKEGAAQEPIENPCEKGVLA